MAVPVDEETPQLPEDDAPDAEVVAPAARYPVVAIVGRPNVGKSSLLNALARKRIAIVQDQPGVTRDRVTVPMEVDTPHGPRWVELTDTGGYGFEDGQGLTDHIRLQVEAAMQTADLVLFVVDAHVGILPGDQLIADLLRRLDRDVVLIANKDDSEKHDLSLGDFARLGFGTPRGVSATTGRGINRIHEAVAGGLDLVDAPMNPPRPDLKVAIVGKRNAGKSTLVNAIARLFKEEQDRVIVSEVAGTTRDSVDVVFEKDGRTMTVIDTAGVRKRRHMVTDDVEFYGFHRAQRSVRRADVVLLLLDSSIPVAEPDKKLAQYVVEQEKPVVVVLNKWDTTREVAFKAAEHDKKDKPRDSELMEEFRDYLDAELPGLSFAPTAFITASEGKNVASLLDLCRNLFKQSGDRVGTGVLNRAVEQAMSQRTPGGGRGGRRRPRVYYATQVSSHPPHIVVFVNDPALFDQGYRRFLLNRLRDALPFEDVPIRLTFRPRRRDDDTEGELRQGRRARVDEDGD
jgi:GTP-binding protein